MNGGGPLHIMFMFFVCSQLQKPRDGNSLIEARRLNNNNNKISRHLAEAHLKAYTGNLGLYAGLCSDR
jgi:hypothetical protein